MVSTAGGLPRSADVVVVGAGTAGCVVAARLASRGDRSVLLLEQGDGSLPGPTVTSLGRLPLGDPERVFTVPERGGRPVVRGRGLGGSSAVNGGYFLRPHAGDFADWPDWWDLARIAAGFAAVESRLHVSAFTDDELGDMPWAFEAYWSSGGGAGASGLFHGGPATTKQPIPEESAAEAEAWARPGLLRVRSNRRSGRRVSTAEALLPTSRPARGAADVQAVGEAKVAELVADAGRIIGVRVGEETVHAGEVIVCAGTLGTAKLLWRSGILDLLGVGELATQEHAERIVRFTPRRQLTAPALLQAVVHTDDGLEIRCYGDDFARFIDGSPARGVPVGVADLAHPAIGSWRDGILDLGSPDEVSAERMERGVERVIAMLQSPEFAGLVEPGSVAVDPVIGMSQHASGTLPLGEVLDHLGGVPVVRGLRVVDGSVLPGGLRSGPHATIAMAAWVIAGALD